MTSKHAHKDRRSYSRLETVILSILFFVFLILALTTSYLIFRYKILAFRNYNYYIIGILALLAILIGFLLFRGKAFVLNLVLSSLAISVLLVALFQTSFALDIYKKISRSKSMKNGQSINASTDKDMSERSFNIYVSGIDTYGSVKNVSRSDVNVIVTVNNASNKVLLTTTPRDTYLQIADGGKNEFDKLTHSGIYGIEASIHTLEKLYGIVLDHYVRLNFTSFLKLVDLVGGIDVDNEQTFSDRGYTFPKGKVHLDSKKALVFVRARYTLKDGDKDRGRNHERVIEALIRKLDSKDALSNYKEILTHMSDSIQTDIPLDVLMDMVNARMNSGASYQIESQDLQGRGVMGLPSHAMPESKLYMMEIDKDSLDKVSRKIKDTYNEK